MKQHLIFGSGGMVGAAITRALRRGCGNGLSEIVDIDLREPLDWRNVGPTPDVIWMCAARVGGIEANMKHAAEFIIDNLAIQQNVIRWSLGNAPRALIVFMGSSCIYPKVCTNPISEVCLMNGKLEPTNSPYAMAKLAGIETLKACERQYGTQWLGLMPCNMYGPGDHFETDRSHVLAALVKRFCDAKEAGAATVTVWGTGTPRREFLHVDDFATAAVELVQVGARGLINVGNDCDISIEELAFHIAVSAGFSGDVIFDPNRPNGIPSKLLSSALLHALLPNWRPRNFLEGIRETVNVYRSTRCASSSAR